MCGNYETTLEDQKVSRDVLGMVYEEGKVVAYPTRKGSEMKMNYGTIAQVLSDRLIVEPVTGTVNGGFWYTGKEVALKTLDRVLVVATSLNDLNAR